VIRPVVAAGKGIAVINPRLLWFEMENSKHYALIQNECTDVRSSAVQFFH
jgi:hypothetical protein